MSTPLTPSLFDFVVVVVVVSGPVVRGLSSGLVWDLVSRQGSDPTCSLGGPSKSVHGPRSRGKVLKRIPDPITHQLDP